MTTLVPPATDPAHTPGALQEHKTRELADGSLIEFEQAPFGWLTKAGERRRQDHRAYYYTPQPECSQCDGSGRQPSVKRPDSTIQCSACKGSGQCKRDRKISVTTLLDSILPKPGLPPWYEARGIEGTVRALQLGLITAKTDPLDAVKIVREAKLGAERATKAAADRGLNVHALNEDYMLTGRVANPADHPAEHRGYIQAWVRWLVKHKPEPVAVEQLVCDPAAGYAGRRDLVAMSGGRRVGNDFKTQENSGIYSSAHVQLRLYEQGAIACGDDPCDALEVVVFAADGEFRVMPCEALPRTVEVALEWHREIKPIDSRCATLNLAEKKARR